MDVEALKERFVKLVERYTVNPVPARAWADMLIALYQQPHRKYHGLGHIADLLRRMDSVRGAEFANRSAVEAAIWFHDAIYVVGSAENENKSRDLAASWVDTCEMWSIRDQALDAIDATKHDGRNLGARPAAQLMVDLDLAGFADPWDDFQAANARIREEFSRYSDEEYRWGRVKFLSGLMTRPIYNLLTELEAPAKANIARHMRDLIGGTK